LQVSVIRNQSKAPVPQGAGAFFLPSPGGQEEKITKPRPDAPKTRWRRGMPQAAHGCAALARWSRTRNCAMRHTPALPRLRPESTHPNAVAVAVAVAANNSQAAEAIGEAANGAVAGCRPSPLPLSRWER